LCNKCLTTKEPMAFQPPLWENYSFFALSALPFAGNQYLEWKIISKWKKKDQR